MLQEITFQPFSWLPIKACIEYKLSYLSLFLFMLVSYFLVRSIYTPKRKLWSSDNKILCIHKLRTKTFGQCSFSFATPTIWNSLPSEHRHTDSIQKFKLALKTHLFWKFFTCYIKCLLTSMWIITFDPLVLVWDCVTVNVWLVKVIILFLLFIFLLLLVWSIRLHVPVYVRECTINYLIETTCIYVCAFICLPC